MDTFQESDIINLINNISNSIKNINNKNHAAKVGPKTAAVPEPAVEELNNKNILHNIIITESEQQELQVPSEDSGEKELNNNIIYNNEEVSADTVEVAEPEVVVEPTPKKRGRKKKVNPEETIEQETSQEE